MNGWMDGVLQYRIEPYSFCKKKKKKMGMRVVLLRCLCLMFVHLVSIFTLICSFVVVGF